MYVCVLTTKHTFTRGCIMCSLLNLCLALEVHVMAKWTRSLMSIDQPGVSCPEREICVSLSVWLQASRGVGVCLCVSICATVCMCAPCTLASLSYPLHPVQETNKLHFNLRNINFPLDGKLIMAVEPSCLTLSNIYSVTAVKSSQPQWQQLINTSVYKDDNLSVCCQWLFAEIR